MAERSGEVLYFEEEDRIVAAVPKDRAHLTLMWNCEDRMVRPDGSVLVQLPHCHEACKLLVNAGVTDVIPFAPICTDKELPLVEGKYAPLRHQLLTAAFITLNHRCYVLSEPRLGKTGSTILAMDWLQRKRMVTGGVLVITTYTTMNSVWAASIRETVPNAVVRPIHGKKGRREALSMPADWYVTNYDSVRIDEAEFLRAIDEGRIGAVVVDELTHAGNPSSMRSKALAHVCGRPSLDRVVGLTGSPADNVEAVYGMARTINPMKLPCHSMSSWRYLTMYQYGSQSWMVKPRHESPRIINETLQPAIRYRKADVFDLPPVTEQIRECRLSKEQAAALEELRTKAVALLESGDRITAANGGVMLMRALQIVQGVIKVDDERGVTLDHEERTRTLLEAIDETNRKVVVFSPFVFGCEMLADDLTKAGHTVRTITGDVSGRERDRILKDFQTATDPRILVCHPITVGFGTELSRADTMVFSVPLLLGGFVYNQSLERLSSVKQTSSNINIIHIISTRMEYDVLKRLREGHSYGKQVASFFEMSARNTLTA